MKEIDKEKDLRTKEASKTYKRFHKMLNSYESIIRRMPASFEEVKKNKAEARALIPLLEDVKVAKRQQVLELTIKREESKTKADRKGCGISLALASLEEEYVCSMADAGIKTCQEIIKEVWTGEDDKSFYTQKI